MLLSVEAILGRITSCLLYSQHPYTDVTSRADRQPKSTALPPPPPQQQQQQQQQQQRPPGWSCATVAPAARC
jgi:hypothetical protein